MKSIFWLVVVSLASGSVTKAQIAVSLAGRSILKLLPDYGRPKVYGLNGGSSAVSGTLLASEALAAYTANPPTTPVGERLGLCGRLLWASAV